MRRVSLLEEHLTPEAVWESWEVQRESVSCLMSSILGKLARNDPSLMTTRFFGMALGEVEDYFTGLEREIDHETSLNLLAAAEAVMMVDFYHRVYEKRKDRVSRRFRRLHTRKRQQSRPRVSLDEEVLEIWSSERPSAKKSIGQFRGALNYRHWLAHGRYWAPKLGMRYFPQNIQEIVEALFDELRPLGYQQA